MLGFLSVVEPNFEMCEVIDDGVIDLLISWIEWKLWAFSSVTMCTIEE